MGQEETCNGDPARRLGNEYLFQVLATQLSDETVQSRAFANGTVILNLDGGLPSILP